jgi:hypothetical protein
LQTLQHAERQLQHGRIACADAYRKLCSVCGAVHICVVHLLPDEQVLAPPPWCTMPPAKQAIRLSGGCT